MMFIEKLLSSKINWYGINGNNSPVCFYYYSDNKGDVTHQLMNYS